MAITTTGKSMLADAIIGGTTYNKLNSSNAHLGVGDSNTAFDAAQTDLQASTNKLRKAMDETYPSRSSNVVTFQASFDEEDANFAWNEWALFNASSSGEMFSRKVSSLGTKTDSAAWVLQVTITFS